jgi:uncharacterized OsmC-like protein
VDIEHAEVDVRGTFSQAEKYDLEGPGTAFELVTYDLAVRSPASEDQVRRLAAHAERGCHTAQSLRTTVPIRIAVTLNGRALEA